MVLQLLRAARNLHCIGIYSFVQEVRDTKVWSKWEDTELFRMRGLFSENKVDVDVCVLAGAVVKGISIYKEVQKDDESKGYQDVRAWHSAVC